MKVAQVVCTFPPYKGGIGNSVYEFSKELAKSTDLTVFAPNFQKTEELKNENFKIIRIKPFIKYKNAAFIPQIFSKLSDFDIIHLHYPFFGGAEAVWLRKILKKQKLIITYHQDSLIGSGIRKYIFYLYNKIMMPLIIKSADKVLCSSQDYIENSNLTKFYNKNKEKFLELPLGINIEKFRPKEKNDDILKKYNISNDEKIILFVGALSSTHPFKGVPNLIKSIEILKNKNQTNNTKVLIVGEGDLKSTYQKLTKQLNLEDIIIFAENVSNNDLVDYYNLAYCSLLPSINKSEVFGLVLVEAMACQKPVIASNLPGVRTVLSNDYNGLIVEPNDINDLADKIKILLNDENLAKQFGENGLKKAREKYDIKKITENLINIYKQL